MISFHVHFRSQSSRVRRQFHSLHSVCRCAFGLSNAFHRHPASYAVTTYIIVAGVCPMFLIPFTSIYGRRPFYIVSLGQAI